MDLELKYLEDNVLYEIDDWFFAQLRKFSVSEAEVIIGQILSVLNRLPCRDGWSQSVYGVVAQKEPTFFVVEYLKQSLDIPILVDIEIIEVNEYLDAINKNKSIKSYLNGQTITDIILERGGVSAPQRDNKGTNRSSSKEQ